MPTALTTGASPPFTPDRTERIVTYRFTTPTSGIYQVAASFLGLNISPTTTDVHVLLNDTPIFNGTVNGFGPGSGPSFNTSLKLAAGDRLDFAVGYGNGSHINDSTGINARLSLVPEPSSLVMLGVGAAVTLSFRVWRRRA